MMQALEETARARGLAELIGLVLKDNDEMGGMMRKRGYAPHRDEEDPGVLRYIKPLIAPTPGPLEAVEPA